MLLQLRIVLNNPTNHPPPLKKEAQTVLEFIYELMSEGNSILPTLTLLYHKTNSMPQMHNRLMPNGRIYILGLRFNGYHATSSNLCRHTYVADGTPPCSMAQGRFTN